MLEITGFIVSVIGFLITIIILIYNYFKTNTYRKKNRLEKIFENVCKSPATNISKYKRTYNKLFSYYELENTIKNEWNSINVDYFRKNLKGYKIKIRRKNDLLYKFPVVYKDGWFKSSNPNLAINIKDPKIKLEEFNRKNHLLYERTKEFLANFDVLRYSEFLRSIDKKIWNDVTFDLKNIDKVGDKLELEFIKGCYYNYVDFYELILKELYIYLYTHDDKDNIKQEFSELKNLLPERFIIREKIGTNFDNFNDRPTKIGINIFVLMKMEEGVGPDRNKDKYCTFFQKRGSDQIEFPGFYHVVPAGTFQPLSTFTREIVNRQFNFSYTILRELLEEVYHLDEADKKLRRADPFQIFKMKKGEITVKKNGKEVKESFIPGELLGLSDSTEIDDNNDHYEVIPTGFLIDLTTLKPELTVVLHIKDNKVYQKSKKFFGGNWEGSIWEVEIGSDNFKNFINEYLNIENFLPAGAVAVAEGINYYNKITRK
ncbi:MAG: hypothetical protein V5A64_06565 [Candidatus Thermoplasmatota archaeon]